MCETPPTWQSLPLFFKQNVVKSLDFASRHHLRLCSKTDFNLVKATPLFLNDVIIYLYAPPHSDFTIHIIDNFGVRYKFNKVAQLENIFYHKNSKFERVTFCLYLENEHECDELEEMVKIFESLDFKIKVQKLGWMYDTLLNGKFFQIFQKFEIIELWPLDCSLSPEGVKKLVETENFKTSIKKFQSFKASDYDYVKDFNRVDQLFIDVPRLEIENVWKLIKQFQTKIVDSGPDAYFHLTAAEEFPLQQFLQQLVAPTKNPGCNEEYPEFSQILPTSSEKYHLKLEVGRFFVRGKFSKN